MHERHDLTGDERALVEPLLPDRIPRRGGQWRDHRQVVNGVLGRVRTGAPWRDMPAAYGPWETVYCRHRRWSADGTWKRVLDGRGLRHRRRRRDVDRRGRLHARAGTTPLRHRPPVDVPADRLEDAAAASGYTGGGVE